MVRVSTAHRTGRKADHPVSGRAPTWGQCLLLSRAPVAHLGGTEGSTNWKIKREMYWFTPPGLGLPQLQASFIQEHKGQGLPSGREGGGQRPGNTPSDPKSTGEGRGVRMSR